MSSSLSLSSGAVWPAFDGVQVEVLLYSGAGAGVFRLIWRRRRNRQSRPFEGDRSLRRLVQCSITSLLFGFLVLEEGVLNNDPAADRRRGRDCGSSIFLHGLTARWATSRSRDQALRRTNPDAPEKAAAARRADGPRWRRAEGHLPAGSAATTGESRRSGSAASSSGWTLDSLSGSVTVWGGC